MGTQVHVCMSPGTPPALPSLPAPTAESAGQFYSFIREAMLKDVRRMMRQEIRSAHKKPGRKRGGRGAELRRKKDFRQEKLRRLRQSDADRSHSTSVSSPTHSCSAPPSSLAQVVCDGRRRKLISSSLVAWRRYTQVTRCARDYRSNNSRSKRTVKPMFQCWRRSATAAQVELKSQVDHSMRVRSFVSTRVNRSMWVVLAQWRELTRHRVKLCRISSKFALGRAWEWWCDAVYDISAACVRDPPPAVAVRSDSYHELMTYSLPLVGRHREWQEIQEFHRSCSSRGVVITCVVCPQDGPKLKRCSTCKAVWYCSRKCQSAHWSEHTGACFKPDLHLVHLLDMCSSADLQRLDLTLKVCDEDY